MTSHEEQVEADTTSQQLTTPTKGDENIVHNPPFFAKLNSVWHEVDQLRKDECQELVKVAILDTGIDLKHPDFEKPRAISFQQGKPISAAGEPNQKDRIKGCWDCMSGSSKAETMEDCDGHGTKVASIILRLAPGAELYIARISRGNDQRNLDEGGGQEAEQDIDAIIVPRMVVEAIDWAIDRGVDIINMSFGFPEVVTEIQDALKRAQGKGILIFAAAGNGGMYTMPHWPAGDSTIAIGINSCDVYGRKSTFTPWPIADNPNFMVIGEGIMAHWPTTRPYIGPNSIDGFGPVEGTSFATPVAVAMAAIILEFTRRGSAGVIVVVAKYRGTRNHGMGES
ncbi:peptidase S8/S53 domain-containing protein [Diplogelasinospora grovesii]|uniref:Peptidase S8/S53 domain-containing protein n=1 Tax=Diplogelasinospora grovesii TaxID=303347 RepID=A0AAN6S3W7_9PEZI|nr:peptidase S8/S53 domain-containing protein [Diplogelasinospora grovesii]